MYASSVCCEYVSMFDGLSLAPLTCRGSGRSGRSRRARSTSDARSDDGDDETARRRSRGARAACRLETAYEQADGARGRPDQPRGRTREHEPGRSRDDADPADASRAREDGSEPDREREGRQRREVRVTEEGRLPAPCRPRVRDMEAEDLQEAEAGRHRAPGDDHAATTSQSSRRRSTSGSETASSAYSENFAAVTRWRERLRAHGDPHDEAATLRSRAEARDAGGQSRAAQALPQREGGDDDDGDIATSRRRGASTRGGTRTPGWYRCAGRGTGRRARARPTPGLTPERMKARVLSASVSATATNRVVGNALPRMTVLMRSRLLWRRSAAAAGTYASAALGFFGTVVALHVFSTETLGRYALVLAATVLRPEPARPDRRGGAGQVRLSLHRSGRTGDGCAASSSARSRSSCSAACSRQACLLGLAPVASSVLHKSGLTHGAHDRARFFRSRSAPENVGGVAILAAWPLRRPRRSSCSCRWRFASRRSRSALRTASRRRSRPSSPRRSSLTAAVGIAGWVAFRRFPQQHATALGRERREIVPSSRSRVRRQP